MYAPRVRKDKKEARVGARVTRYCRGVINALMQKYNMSEGEVMEFVFRDYAERHGTQPIYWDEAKEEH